MRVDLKRDRYALDRVMEFDHVIRVHENGEVTDDVAAVWAPEVYDNSEDGGPEDVHVSPDAWRLLSGFTGQWGYGGPVMHPSEFIGGALAEHILETPGYWVAVIVKDADGDIGWAVAHRDV